MIPEEIRNRLGLKAGAQFVVLGDRDVVIFKVLEPPSQGELTGWFVKCAASRNDGHETVRYSKAMAKLRRATRWW